MPKRKTGSRKIRQKPEAEKKNKDKSLINGKNRFEYILMAIMVIFVAWLLFVGPFQRGLFFPRELLLAQALIFGLLIVWGVFQLVRKENPLWSKRLIGTPLDICLLLLLVAYCVSLFVAVNKRDALEETMKIAAYLVVYLVIIDVCRNWRVSCQKPDKDPEESVNTTLVPPGLNLVLHLLLLAASVITIASLGVAAGQWDFLGAYAANRIASPMGYANTAAAYLMAAYLLTIALAPLANKWFKALYMAPATLMLMTVILTFSRGAWLLLPPLALLLVLAAAPGERLRTFLYLFVTALTAIPTAFMVDPIFRAETSSQAWWLIISAALIAVALGILVELYLSRSYKLRIALAGTVMAVIVAVLIIMVVIPLMSPLQLDRSSEELAQVQTIEQVINISKPGETYQLSLEVNAEQTPLSGIELPEYIWGVRVLEDVPGYRDLMLFNHQGNETNGWEEKLFTFQTGEETTRLVIQIYNQYPGTSATVRSVILSSSLEEQNLRFVLNRILPARFYDRLFSYSLDRNMDRRFELFRDAIKVIRDYPVFGTGGGGFAALYQVYQEQPYASREVHNHFLQVWVEAGIFGFLAFIGIWISFTVAFIRNCLRNRAHSQLWQYWTASFLPVAALGAHSAIDWNFSMAAVGIFLFVLLGAGRSLDSSPWFEKIGANANNADSGLWFRGIAGIIVGISLFVYSIILINGLDATWQSQGYLEHNNLKQATTEMEKAIRLDPLRAENYHNLNIITEEQFKRTGNPESVQEMLYLSQQAYELEPFNPNYVNRYGILLLQYVDVEEGLSYLDQSMILRPYLESSYLQPALARLNIAEYYLETGNRREADQHLKEILKYEQIMEKNNIESSSMVFVLGRANHLLRDYSVAVDYYQAVSENNYFYDLARNYVADILGEDEIIEQ